MSGQVKVASKIDSDVTDFNPYFDLIIIATVDRQQDSQSTHTNTTVFVGDLNDNVPRFNSKEYDMSVAEDFVGRLTAYEIKVYDPDMVKSLWYCAHNSRAND